MKTRKKYKKKINTTKINTTKINTTKINTTRRFKHLKTTQFYKKPPETIFINGFKFLLLPLKCNTFQMTCKIFGGNYLENNKNLGISHLLEHVITDSWKKCYKKGCVKLLEKYGTISNAHTMHLSTGYWIKGLAEFKQVLLDYIINIAIDPHIKSKKMMDEKEAVRNEIINYMNNPNYDLQNATAKLLFKNTGLQYSADYNIQLNNLKKFTVKQLTDFAHKIISEKRILFIISGSFNKQELIRTIKQIFNSIPQTKLNSFMPKVTSSLCYNIKKHIQFIKNTKNKNSTIFIEFPLDIYQGDEKLIYIPILTQLLGSGLNSLLLNQLREKDNLVYGVAVGFSTNFCGTLISINISTIHKNVKKVLEKTFSVLKKYGRSFINDSLLSHYKLRYILGLQNTCLNTTDAVTKFYSMQYFYQIHKKKPKIYTITDITRVIEKLNKPLVASLIKQLFDTNKCLVCYSSKASVHFTTDDF